jgi:signal transduction histidine kinase/ligand-binding sensor domain-containing protein
MPVSSWRFLYVCCVAVATAPLAWAQDLELVRLPVPDIAHATVQRFAQDASGAIWMGTDRGLVRFDGTATERYVSEPSDPDALPHDMVWDLLMDGDDLWVATAGGAWRMNTRTGAHQAVHYAQPGAPSGAREALAFAASRQGHWAFALSLGVYRYLPGDSLHRAVDEDVPGPQRASGGWEAPDGTLWYCDRMALRHYHPSTGHVDIFPLRPFGKEAPPKTLLLDVLPDRYNDHLLWCRSWGLGLVRFDMRTGSFEPFVASQALNDLTNIVHAAVQMGPDQWVLNLDERLVMWDRGAFSAGRLVLGKGGLYRTADGDLLIGSPGSVHVVRSRPERMQELVAGPAMPNRYTVPTLANDGYWVSQFYADRKVIRCDRDGRELQVLPFPVENPPAEPFLMLMARHGKARGTVWIGSTRGLWMVSGDAGELRLAELDLPGLDTKRPNVTAMVEGDDGTLWMCLGKDGVARYDAVRGAAQWVFRSTTVGELFVSIARLDKDHLFAVRRNAAPLLVRMDGTPAIAMRAPAELQRLYSKLAGGLSTADGGVVVYTAGLGLARFARGTSPEELLPDRTWYLPDRPAFSHAVRDAQGRIWLTSDRGAYMLDPSIDALHALDPLHGIPAVNINNVSVSPDGEVLLLGERTLRFAPSFQALRDSLSFAFRSVQVGGMDRTREAFSGVAHTTPPANDLTVTFSSVSLFAGDVFTYAYQLTHDGRAGSVVKLGKQRMLNLLGLSPGTYTLQVIAEGPAARPAIAQLTFVVEPAWWQTWWARAVFMLFGVALVVLATRHIMALRYRRTLREMERQRELERVRMRIARDVHDGIGSGLTKITMMLRNVPGADPEHAQRIAKASSELVHELGEIVWTVDPRNDDVASFVAFVRHTLGRQTEDLPIHLASTLSFDPALARHMLPPDIKRNVLLVLREAVNNALKHSHGDRIDVALDITANALLLRVSDNGQGFDPAQTREGGNGLFNFKKRAEEIGGSVQVASSRTGTTITLTVPMPSTNVGSHN